MRLVTRVEIRRLLPVDWPEAADLDARHEAHQQS